MDVDVGLHAVTQPTVRFMKQIVARRRRQRTRATTPAFFVTDQSSPVPPVSGSDPIAPVSSSGDEPPHRVSYRRLLRNQNFRLLWLGEAISTFGSMFTRLAIPVYVYTLTRSYRDLGLAVFWGLVASLVFGLVSGVVVDRWNRRTTMTSVSVLNGVLLLGLVGVVVWNPVLPIQLAAIYALNFVTTLLRDLFAAARVAIFPDVLADDEYLAANALDQSTVQMVELLSYPLSILVLWLGPILAFSLDAATFFVSAALLARIRVAPTPTDAPAQGTLLREIGAGLRTTWQLPLVRNIVLLSFVVPLIFSLMFTLQIPYAVDVAGSTEKVGLPLLEGAMALGFVLGALLLSRSRRQWSRSTLLAGGIVGMGGGLLLQGLLPLLVIPRPDWFVWHPTLTVLLLLALPVLLFIGMTNSLVNTSIRTVVQERTPRAMMGRVFSVIQVTSAVGFASGALLTTVAQGRVPGTFVVMGMALVAVGSLSSAWLRRAEHGVPAPMEAERGG